MAILRHIAVHHSGGMSNNRYASTQHLGVSNINHAHKERWPQALSSMGYYVGYNFLITADGNIVQTRALGELTYANRGFNRGDNAAVSICLIGNFSKTSSTGAQPVDRPTNAQVHALRTVLGNLIEHPEVYKTAPETKFKLNVSSVVPHRYLNSTSCFGDSLPDNWARDLISDRLDPKIVLYSQILELLRRIKDERLKKLGRSLSSDEPSCPGHV